MEKGRKGKKKLDTRHSVEGLLHIPSACPFVAAASAVASRPLVVAADVHQDDPEAVGTLFTLPVFLKRASGPQAQPGWQLLDEPDARSGRLRVAVVRIAAAAAAVLTVLAGCSGAADLGEASRQVDTPASPRPRCGGGSGGSARRPFDPGHRGPDVSPSLFLSFSLFYFYMAAGDRASSGIVAAIGAAISVAVPVVAAVAVASDATALPGAIPQSSNRQVFEAGAGNDLPVLQRIPRSIGPSIEKQENTLCRAHTWGRSLPSFASFPGRSSPSSLSWQQQ